jgi:hypothetical protein
MESSPRQFTPKQGSKKEPAALVCRICDKPVTLETAKTDGAGNAVHEECYALKVNLEKASQNGHAHSTRSWKTVAAEVTREQDPKKMTELITELNQALEEQNINGTPKARPDGNPKPCK